MIGVLSALFAAAVVSLQPLPPAKAPASPEAVAPAPRTNAAAPVVAHLPRLAESLVRANVVDDHGRLRTGTVRELAQPVAVGGASVQSAANAWRGAVQVEGAERMRLRLTNVVAPTGTSFWVRGARETVKFDVSLAHQGELWTPSVDGPLLTLDVEGVASFAIAAVLDERNEVRANSDACFVDAACRTGIDELAEAMGRISFISGSSSYVCSGGLLNNDGGTPFTPYFLTANHCIDTASEASSIEVTWRYRASACNGTPPSRSTLPRSNGAQLLVTSASSDVTLLRLSSVPGGRTYLGWDPRAISVGQTIYRLSHPYGGAMIYTAARVESSGPSCSSLPRPSFIYSALVTGATGGGSSGSPVMYGDGYVVGQLTGTCGPASGDNCSLQNREADGAFSTSWPLLQPYLRPEGTANCTACTPGNNTACLLGNRFKVTMPSWRDVPANLSGQGTVIRYADNLPEIHPDFGPLSESAFFSMYGHAPKSIETLVRMIKGQNINNKYWVFLTGFTGAEYTIRIEDTQTCATWQRTVPSGATNVVKDFEAFSF